MKILYPEDSRWTYFLGKLVAYCDLSSDYGPCECEDEYPRARDILGNMRGIDVEATIIELQLLGAHCDCSIIPIESSCTE